MEALRSLLRGFTRTDTAQVAFSRVKELIAPNLALTLFDPALPTLVTTDACDYGIGAVLTQLQLTLKRLLHLHSGPSQIAIGVP